MIMSLLLVILLAGLVPLFQQVEGADLLFKRPRVLEIKGGEGAGVFTGRIICSGPSGDRGTHNYCLLLGDLQTSGGHLNALQMFELAEEDGEWDDCRRGGRAAEDAGPQSQQYILRDQSVIDLELGAELTACDGDVLVIVRGIHPNNSDRIYWECLAQEVVDGSTLQDVCSACLNSPSAFASVAFELLRKRYAEAQYILFCPISRYEGELTLGSQLACYRADPSMTVTMTGPVNNSDDDGGGQRWEITSNQGGRMTLDLQGFILSGEGINCILRVLALEGLRDATHQLISATCEQEELELNEGGFCRNYKFYAPVMGEDTIILIFPQQNDLAMTAEEYHQRGPSLRSGDAQEVIDRAAWELTTHGMTLVTIPICFSFNSFEGARGTTRPLPTTTTVYRPTPCPMQQPNEHPASKKKRDSAKKTKKRHRR